MSAADWFRELPPVSRTLVAATFVESSLIHGQVVPAKVVIFHKLRLFRLLPELWRLVTPFLLVGRDLKFLFDLFFLWTISTGLERHSSRFGRPSDFFTYILFVCSLIIFTSGFLLNSLVLTSAFHLALSYTFAIENRGKRITFIVIPMPAQYFPWARLAFTFVMGGWPAGLSDATGIAAAHAYEFLTEIYPRYQGGKNWIQTPTWVRNAFGDNKPQSRSGPSSVTRGYGTAYRPATGGVRDGGGGGSSSSSAWSSALGGAWGNRGPGRVLGSGD